MRRSLLLISIVLLSLKPADGSRVSRDLNPKINSKLDRIQSDITELQQAIRLICVKLGIGQCSS
ncbi:hypothetical protein AAVH_06678 [Aphelenchoides avenae]|nr:hypothetical protein AAVH_06678 [Aphelenchus avenae]